MRKPVALCVAWVSMLLGYVPAISWSIEEMMLDNEDVVACSHVAVSPPAVEDYQRAMSYARPVSASRGLRLGWLWRPFSVRDALQEANGTDVHWQAPIPHWSST